MRKQVPKHCDQKMLHYLLLKFIYFTYVFFVTVRIEYILGKHSTIEKYSVFKIVFKFILIWDLIKLSRLIHSSNQAGLELVIVLPILGS